MVRPWRPLNPRVIEGHPLATSLIGAVVFGYWQTSVELVRRNHSTTGSLPDVGALQRFGFAHTFDGSSQREFIDCIGPALGSDPASILFVGDPKLSSNADGSLYFGYGLDTTINSVTGSIFCVRKGFTSNRVGIMRCSSSGNWKFVTTDVDAADLSEAVILGTHPGGNNYSKLYYNGSERTGGTSTGGTLGSGSGTSMQFARYQSGGIPLATMTATMAAVWNRELTADDAAWLNADPFAFLEEDHFREFFFLGAAGSSRGDFSKLHISLGLKI